MKLNEKSEQLSLFAYIFMIACLILIVRLWQLQILQGKEYRELSESNRLRIIAIPAPRGIIFDRNGIPLVKNSPYFYASIMPNEFDVRSLQSLSEMLNIPADKIQEEITKNGVSPLTPIRLKQGLSFEEVAYIESRRSDFPGLIIEVEAGREYIYGEVGSHLIGYLGKLTPAQAKAPAFNDVPREAFIGQWGIEKLFDTTLRGSPGTTVTEINALGRELRHLKGNLPLKGEDITLSIDINLLKEAEKAFGEKAGALVAINPNNGELLGLISKPSFDPNLFSKGIAHEDWLKLSQDEKKPILNRALQSQYPHGSTFKVVTAIAGLEEGVITPQTKVNCKGGIKFGGRFFGCWRKRGHGVLSLHKAIAESCDTYFYEVGRRLGIDRMHDYALGLGLGKETGVDLVREKKGVIPDTTWKREHKKLPWFPGETLISAIGQGYVTTTPIQMAVMTGTIVNGGTQYKPMLVKGAQPVILGNFEFDPETLQIVKEALYGVVHDKGGTGWAARSKLTTIGGKTGTAQIVGIKKDSQDLPEKYRDHAWFIAFAPVEKPEIALAVFVEHGGHGGAAAAPIAKRAIEAYIKSQSKLEGVESLEPESE
jgi:penicillin-binding protein 2